MDTILHIHTDAFCLVLDGGKCRAVQDGQGSFPDRLQAILVGAQVEGVILSDVSDFLGAEAQDISWLLSRSGQEEDPNTLEPLTDAYVWLEGQDQWLLKLKTVHAVYWLSEPIRRIRAAPQTMRTTLGATPARKLTPAPPSGVHLTLDSPSNDNEGEPEADAS